MHNEYDLGNYSSATDKSTIDTSFHNLTALPRLPCIYCNQPSTHRLKPIKGPYENAMIEDKGYCCTYCIRHVDRSIYTPHALEVPSNGRR